MGGLIRGLSIDGFWVPEGMSWKGGWWSGSEMHKNEFM